MKAPDIKAIEAAYANAYGGNASHKGKEEWRAKNGNVSCGSKWLATFYAVEVSPEQAAENASMCVTLRNAVPELVKYIRHLEARK